MQFAESHMTLVTDSGNTENNVPQFQPGQAANQVRRMAIYSAGCRLA
jgi:hypothetical protein